MGKPISHANFRLAHLLSEERLAALVVTPNFDDFLPRALTLFGIPHIVCDHPNTVERINPESDEIQIVHVHGTYWFYDGCNLRGEIEARTEDPREHSVTMTSLLGNILARHSAIVIGYAGWEGDVVTTALKRRLHSRLPNNLYWFCYRRGDADILPDWLKNHPDVRMVLPPAPPSKPDSQPTSQAKLASIATELEPTLTAQSVLDKLVGAFTEKSPALTLDPIGFFAAQLRNSFPQDPSEKPGEDIYTLRDVIRRVELAKEAERKPTPIEGEIESVRDAVRRSAYLEALQAADQLESKVTSDAQRETLMESVMSAALGLNDNSEAEMGGYDLVLRLAAAHTGASARVLEHAARALYDKGVIFSQLNRNEEALEVYDEVLRRFGKAGEPALRGRVGWVLLNKGITQGDLNRREEAIETFDEVLRRFGDATESALREQVASALVNKGLQQGNLKRNEEEIQTYDEVLRRFGDSTEPALCEQVARALLNKGITQGDLKRSEEAIQAFDEVLRRFGDSSEPALREQVAKALGNKGRMLASLLRSEEALRTYNLLLSRFGDITEASMRETIAMGHFNKGVTLAGLKRSEEAVQAYDEVVRCFGDAPEPALRALVARALGAKGEALRSQKQTAKAREAFQEIRNRFSDATEPEVKQWVEKAKSEIASLHEPEGSTPQ